MLWLSLFCINTFLLGESIEMQFVVDGTHPWQLCRSCRGCVPFSDMYGQIYLGGNGLTMMDDMHPMVEWCVVRIQ